MVYETQPCWDELQCDIIFETNHVVEMVSQYSLETVKIVNIPLWLKHTIFWKLILYIVYKHILLVLLIFNLSIS